MNKLPWEVPYEKINRGCIYLVGFSFDDGRPLTFVEKDSQGNVKLIDKNYGFEPKFDKNGRPYSPEVSVVIPHKAKYAVVLQDDEENINPEWHYTIVAPIDSIDFSEKNEPIIQRAITKNDVPKVYYTKCTGMDALVQITKIKRIHKNLIFRKTSWQLDETELNSITYKIASILKVGKIPACTECEMNCDNCKLKLVNERTG